MKYMEGQPAEPTPENQSAMGGQRKAKEKPRQAEYVSWLEKERGVDSRLISKTYYDAVTKVMQQDLSQSALWTALEARLKEFADRYVVDTGYQLFVQAPPVAPRIDRKEFDSFLLKTFRKNVLDNKNWPEAPIDGWLLPDNWLTQINDVLRTSLAVKYLDGVERVTEGLAAFGKSQFSLECSSQLEARDYGYYAGHVYIFYPFEIPGLVNWFRTEKVTVSVEIQVTTQLQEVIGKLTHRYYEQRRVRPTTTERWQWQYKSEEFVSNYLGHILHYVEGMIMEVRARQDRGADNAR